MFGIVLSAFNVVLGFVFRSVIVKFALFFGLFFVTTEFIAILSPLLPEVGVLNNAFAGLPSGVWYFLDLFAFSQGVTLIVPAFITRFIIRRLPVIG